MDFEYDTNERRGKNGMDSMQVTVLKQQEEQWSMRQPYVFTNIHLLKRNVYLTELIWWTVQQYDNGCVRA